MADVWLGFTYQNSLLSFVDTGKEMFWAVELRARVEQITRFLVYGFAPRLFSRFGSPFVRLQLTDSNKSWERGSRMVWTDRVRGGSIDKKSK